MWETGVGGNLGLVDGREGRRGRRRSCLAFHREGRDDGVRQLVDDVERLEGRDRRHAAGLRLDDEDLLFPVHRRWRDDDAAAAAAAGTYSRVRAVDGAEGGRTETRSHCEPSFPAPALRHT